MPAKPIALVVAALLAVSAPRVAVAAPAPFRDLAGVPWAAPAILELQRLGLLRGVGGGRFDPAAAATPAAVATIAGRLFRWDSLALDAPPGTPSWAAGYLGHAVARGWAPPGVNPLGPSPRWQVVASIEAAMGWTGGLPWAITHGLLCPSAQGDRLRSPATRAEAALMLYRAAYLERIGAWGAYLSRYGPGWISLSSGALAFRIRYRPGCGA